MLLLNDFDDPKFSHSIHTFCLLFRAFLAGRGPNTITDYDFERPRATLVSNVFNSSAGLRFFSVCLLQWLRSSGCNRWNCWICLIYWYHANTLQFTFHRTHPDIVNRNIVKEQIIQYRLMDVDDNHLYANMHHHDQDRTKNWRFNHFSADNKKAVLTKMMMMHGSLACVRAFNRACRQLVRVRQHLSAVSKTENFELKMPRGAPRRLHGTFEEIAGWNKLDIK